MDEEGKTMNGFVMKAKKVKDQNTIGEELLCVHCVRPEIGRGILPPVMLLSSSLSFLVFFFSFSLLVVYKKKSFPWKSV